MAKKFSEWVASTMSPESIGRAKAGANKMRKEQNKKQQREETARSRRLDAAPESHGCSAHKH